MNKTVKLNFFEARLSREKVTSLAEANTWLQEGRNFFAVIRENGKNIATPKITEVNLKNSSFTTQVGNVYLI